MVLGLGLPKLQHSLAVWAHPGVILRRAVDEIGNYMHMLCASKLTVDLQEE